MPINMLTLFTVLYDILDKGHKYTEAIAKMKYEEVRRVFDS